jgi:hypothetical protein
LVTSDPSGLLEKFKGREENMFDVLQKKYCKKNDHVWGGISGAEEEGGEFEL